MERVFLNTAGVEVSRLSLGTGSFHHLFGRGSRRSLLHSALDGGVTHFDTAPLYGHGFAETELGALLRGQRHRCTITTKFGLYPTKVFDVPRFDQFAATVSRRIKRSSFSPVSDFSLVKGRSSLRQSLKRLRTDYIDCFMIHEPACSSVELQSLIGWLEEEKRAGLIRCWGLAGERKVLANMNYRLPDNQFILQTRGSTSDEVDELDRVSTRNPDFLYGLISSYLATKRADCVKEIFEYFRKRSPNSGFIMSTCQISHLEEACGFWNQ